MSPSHRSSHDSSHGPGVVGRCGSSGARRCPSGRESSRRTPAGLGEAARARRRRAITNRARTGVGSASRSPAGPDRRPADPAVLDHRRDAPRCASSRRAPAFSRALAASSASKSMPRHRPGRSPGSRRARATGARSSRPASGRADPSRRSNPGSSGSTPIFRTARDAPRGQAVAADLLARERGLVDDRDVDAVARQVVGGRRASGACPDDQDVGLDGAVRRCSSGLRGACEKFHKGHATGS